jgi:hypothetical protein
MGETTIHGGTAHLAEIVVTGGGEHVQLRLAATGVGSAFDGLHQVVIDTHRNLIGISVVVAEEGGVIADVQAHGLEAFPVGSDRCKHLVHSVFPVSNTCFFSVVKQSVIVPRPVHWM